MFEKNIINYSRDDIPGKCYISLKVTDDYYPPDNISWNICTLAFHSTVKNNILEKYQVL